jgi:hypothetical protein
MRAYMLSFQVKPDQREAFRRAYGRSEDWASFFAQSTSYHETMRIENADVPPGLLTIDVFQTRAARERPIEARRSAYADLGKILACATAGESHVGQFDFEN